MRLVQNVDKPFCRYTTACNLDHYSWGVMWGSDRPPLVEREQESRIRLVEWGPELLKGAVLGAPKIFWEPAGTSDHFRYKP